MKIKEIRKFKQSELHTLLAEKRSKLRELRFKDANKQLGNIRELRQIKRNIAQILTVLNSKKETKEVKDKTKKTNLEKEKQTVKKENK